LFFYQEFANSPEGGRAMNRALTIALMVFLAGCAGPAPRGAQSAPDRAMRQQAAFDVLQKKPFQFAYMPSRSDGNDGFQLLMLKGGSGTPPANDLAVIIAASPKAYNRVAVSGANDAVTAYSLLYALNRNKDRQFPGLEIVFIGNAEHLAEIKSATEAIGATLLFIQYPKP
jgi:hypothetical protein